ncbi:uncharacterized protein VICG_01313 [Vittaforma corneae ATCC 50505]|uniref:Rad4 beta-hairpin domain-containing protein n=1 Tax=Vittaforma corneae (strain ATCC 50505) TaxID=993615 RepID=L2GMG9_VITCO|nr:uncharacterized protein VICG_01313 [Vittaforma corneae ATCC 50505]ELA41680.1 hypothetical protein VICG_01313 [Vittaforma corneae ATCC 50505]
MKNSSSESWDSASVDELKLTVAQKKTRASNKLSKLKILHQFLFIIECLRMEREYILAGGLNDYEKFENICKDISEGGINSACMGMFCGLFPGVKGPKHCFAPPFDGNISLFVNLNANSIPCRIYFSLGKEIESFLEYSLNSTVVKYKSTVDGLCFSVDFNGFISDQTVNFSKKYSHHHFFVKIINEFVQKEQVFGRKDREGNGYSFEMNRFDCSAFSMLDSQRLRSIPQCLSKIKIHPIYMLEECCRFNETIYPKRPVFGYYKGKPVFPKNNIVKLRTENGWYYQGRVLKDNKYDVTKPYRIYKGKRLYAEFQTEPVDIRSITGSVMDAFHPNFTPKGCVYVDYDPQIAIDLNLNFAECIVGHRGKEKIKRGFYIEKKYCFITNYFIKEKEYYKGMVEEIEKIEKTIGEWRRFIRKVMRMAEIRKRVGLS